MPPSRARQPEKAPEKQRVMELPSQHYGSQVITPFFVLIWLTVFLRLILGNTLLNSFISYTLPGGTFLEKIHPANYLLFPALALLLFQRKFYENFQLCRRNINDLLLFFTATALIALISVAIKGPAGMAYLVDTHIFAAALGIIAYCCSAQQKRFIKTTVLIFVVINSLLAIGEMALQRHLIGYAQHAHMPSFRAAAFFGHPLKNALITSTALFFVFTTSWRPGTKLLFSTLYAIALLCYGGRMASIVITVATCSYLLVLFFRDFKERPKYLEISIFIFSIPVILLTGYVLVNYFGLGSRMFERELLDQSGMARINLFYIFSYISLDTLITGMPAADVVQLSRSALDMPTIENFWVMLILVLGLPVAVLIGGFLLNALYGLSRPQDTAGKLGAIAFLLIASSNNSLTTKSASLTILILLLVTSLPPDTSPVHQTHQAQ